MSTTELKCRKRKRGPLLPAAGEAIHELDVDRVKTKDNHVWHKHKNPHLPDLMCNRIEPGGPTVATNQATTPVECFSLFLTDQSLAAVCVHTNRRIRILRERFKTKEKHTTSDVSLIELKGLLGILILSGVKKDNHVPITDMWSELDGAPMYKSTMSKERFAFLLRALRFDDAATRKERMKEDRLAPIRSLWDDVVLHCQECYQPGPHLTVDEQLLGFRGNCSFRMYIPNKPAK